MDIQTIAQKMLDNAAAAAAKPLKEQIAEVTEVTSTTFKVQTMPGATPVTVIRCCNAAVGDRVVVLKDGTQWSAVSRVGGESGGQLTSARTLYIDNINGNDANDGSSTAKAVKTMARLAAVANAVDEGTFYLSLSFAPSATSYGDFIVGGNSAGYFRYNKAWLITSNGAVTFGSIQSTGSGTITLSGSAATTYNLSGNLICQGGGYISAQGGVTLSAGNINVTGGGNIRFSGAGKVSATSQIRVNGGGYIDFGNTTEIACATMLVTYGGAIYLTGPGTLTTTGALYVNGGGLITFGSRSVNVGTYLSVDYGGLIDFATAPEVHVGTTIKASSGSRITFSTAGSSTDATLITCASLSSLAGGELLTNGRAFTGVNQIANVMDYVTAVTTSGSWKLYTNKSGRKQAIGNLSLGSVAMTNGFGSLFYTDKTIAIPAFFTSVTNVQAQTVSANGLIFCAVSSFSTSSIVSYIISATNTTQTMSLHVAIEGT